MVTADTQTYVNAEGETVEASPHEWAIMYRSQGFVLKETPSEEEAPVVENEERLVVANDPVEPELVVVDEQVPGRGRQRGQG